MISVPATIVDLDGTYVTCNTLKVYILTGLKHCFSNWHAIDAVGIVSIIFARRLRLISHRSMKFRIHDILAKYQGFMSEFQKKVNTCINRSVADIIRKNKAKGHRILLASAALDYYIPLIWAGEYVATATTCNPGKIECRGEEKLRKVKEWLTVSGCHIDTVLTDNCDDAPLVRYNVSGTNILVEPDAASLRFFREFEPSHFLLIEDSDDFRIAD